MIYFNKGTKCLVRLFVSIFTLRRHYSGPVAVLLEGDHEEWVFDLLDDFKVEAIPLETDIDERPLVRKAQLWRWTPFRYSMFIDADTVVLNSINQFFVLIRDFGFVVHQFSDWVPTGTRMEKRIKQWSKVVGEDEIEKALRFPFAINTGVFGFCKGHPLLAEWESVTRKGQALGATTRMVDEVACQVILHRFTHKVVSSEWGASAVYHNGDNPIIRHFHGNKEVLDSKVCDEWKAPYWELRNHSRFYRELGVPGGNRRFRKYLKRCSRQDLTVVSAVNPKYLERFRKNFDSWMRTEGLREQKFVIFVSEFTSSDERLMWLHSYSNVRMYPWSHAASEGNTRERMLSAFVFGVAKYVKTEFWLKMDADAEAIGGSFPVWEIDYHEHTLVGHRWGYTKVKADMSDKHWVNLLDEWFVNVTGKRLDAPFPETPVEKRFQHKRISSFTAFERTSHTRELASLSKGRLPVPSQDTSSWYLAFRQGRSIKRINMKQWISH